MKLIAVKFICLTAFCLLLPVDSPRVYADTVSLQITGVGGQSSDGFYVYPYYFSINGSANVTSLMCINFTNEIGIGDSWNATVQSIVGTTEEEAAWLYEDANLNPGDLVDDQWAAWELFDPGLTGPDQTGIAALLSSAQSGITNMSFADFVLYVPVAGSKSQSTGDFPQSFLGSIPQGGARLSNSPAPEPGSLILLGSGLLGLSILLYRRSQSV